MNWSFNAKGDLTENVTIQDQTFTPDEISILFVIYDHERETRSGLMRPRQQELIERLIVEGTVPSRKQYELAKRMGGIMRRLDETTEH